MHQKYIKHRASFSLDLSRPADQRHRPPRRRGFGRRAGNARLWQHSHATPLHQAALAGHEAAVRLLVERGVRLDIENIHHRATPFGWAEYAGQAAVAEYLRSRTALQRP